MALANGGHVGSYGGDPYTAAAIEVLRGHFGADAEVFFVFNGTGANVVSLQAMTKRWDAVICAESAHINVDECGAAEKIAGLKLLSVATPDGKLTPALIDVHAWGFGDVHHAQPRVVSITQSTELGTVYSAAGDRGDLRRMPIRWGCSCTSTARASRMRRLPSASRFVRSRRTSVSTSLSLGGTKNGLLYGEAIVVLNPAAVSGVEFLRKAGMQLASKMRFVGVQFEVLFGTDLWLRSATHANAMARRLADATRDIAGVQLTREPEANSVYAILPADVDRATAGAGLLLPVGPRDR